MKRLLSLILCVAVLVSTTVTAQAKEGEDEAYHTINVEFSDSDGAIETLQVMVKNDNVYANAEELGKRLGYQVNISEEYVSICNKDENETVPYGLTVFYFNSTQISHMLFNKMVYYEAPFEIVKNEEGAWIPLEQSLLLLNSSMLIVDNVIIIDMPEKNIIDIYMDILKNNSTLLFDWNSDFGYTDWDWKVIGGASHVVNMFNGLLKKDGDTWVQFVQMFAMNTSSYDSKYGETIAELFCTYSDEELSQEVQKMKKVMGYFDTSGTLGKTLKTLEKSVPSDADIKTLQKTCNQLREKIDGSSTSIAAYNRAYQALENATDEATLFADSLAGSVLEIEKNVSSATSFMDKFFKIAEVIGYAKEFQNQDKFAVEALDEYVSNSDSQSLMSKAMKSGISDYITTLKTDIVSYSALKYLNENYDSLIMEATDLSSALGTQANLELIAWDLIQSANILNIGDKIKAADKFELALYSSVFQGDAFVSYQSVRDFVFSDVSNVTPENLYSVSQYCYTYLKSCYITRNAAVASLKGKTKDVQEQIQPLIDYENGINETIAEYLVCLKDADRTNEKLCYGFLPEDNEEYLKNYDNTIADVLSETEMKDYMEQVTNVYNDFILDGEYKEYLSDWSMPAEAYCILDVNQDGIPELFIKMSPEFDEWTTIALFSYDVGENKVVYIDQIYSYAGLQYSSKYKAIVSSETRPSELFGANEFSTVDGLALKQLFLVGWDTDETGKFYFYMESDANKQRITEDKELSFYNDLVYIEFASLPTDKNQSNTEKENLSTNEYNKYEVFEMNLTWDEAKAYCENLGGHLATITSEEEQNVVYDLLENGEYGAYWLGANVSNGKWNWITGEEFGYQNWDAGEPNRGEEGMCLQMYEANGHWDDTWLNGDKGGGYKEHGFVCEYE